MVDDAGDPLIFAGGGGGTRASVSQDGCDGRSSEYGGEGSGWSGTSSCAAKTTDLGQGGVISSSSWGSAGAGFDGDGAKESSATSAAKSWANGMYGGNGSAWGGFGGGGAGNGACGGGGGGGYSGGDGGRLAGGGGSYNAGDNPTTTAGVNTGDGQVTIEML